MNLIRVRMTISAAAREGRGAPSAGGTRSPPPHSYLQVYIDDVIIVTASQETHVRAWEHLDAAREAT